MPIVKVGNERIKFPDSMSQDEIGAVLKQRFDTSQEPAKTQEQAASTAPVAEEPTTAFGKLDNAISSNPIGKVASEFASAVNRGAINLAEFLTTDQINAVMSVAGSEKRVPALREMLPNAMQEGLGGGFMEEGLPRDIVAGAGEVVPAAVGGTALLQNAAARIPAATGMVKDSIATGALRQLAQGTFGQAAKMGAVGGAGAVVGGEVGEDIAGENGKLVGQVLGSIVAPLSASALAGAGKKALGSAVNQSVDVAPSVKIVGPDTKIAKYIQDGAGKMRTDPNAIEVMKQGVPEGVVAAIKGSTPQDLDVMRAMLRIAKQGKSNARFGAENRPADALGVNVVERLKAVREINKDAGSRLDGVAQSLKNKKADMSPAVKEFYTKLDGMGVSLSDDLVPSFKGSDIEGLDGPTRIIKRVLGRIKSTGLENMTPFDAHRMKRYIDEQVSFGKQTEGLSGKVENTLKSLRRGLDKTLDDNFPEYKEVNDQYSASISALDSFKKAAGRNFDMDSPRAAQQAGILSRRLLSNVQSKAGLADSLSDLQNVAKAYNVEFKDDIITQVMFASELERLLGSSAANSLGGIVEKSVGKTIGAATGRGSLTDIMLDAGNSLYKTAAGVSDDKAISALEKLLGSQK